MLIDSEVKNIYSRMTIKSLLNQYKCVIDEFGEKRASNKIFMKDLINYVNNDIIDPEDANLVCDIIGLRKDKLSFSKNEWQQCKENVHSILTIMDILENVKNDKRENFISSSYQNKIINQHIYDICCDLYLSNNSLNEWKKFLKKYKDDDVYYCIDAVDNSNHHYISFNEIYNNLKNGELDFCLSKMALSTQKNFYIYNKEKNFYIDNKENSIFNIHTLNTELSKKAEKFNYKKIFQEYIERVKANQKDKDDKEIDNEY